MFAIFLASPGACRFDGAVSMSFARWTREDREEMAAVRLQCTWRGHHLRKSVGTPPQEVPKVVPVVEGPGSCETNCWL